MGIIKRIGDWERNLRAYYNTDLSTSENRRRAHIYNMWFDHAVLRKFWTNFHPVADGVYRSNQPTHERFVKLKAMGIKSILNLRGESNAAHHLVEAESCRELGLNLVNVTLLARYAAPAENILKTIDAFRAIEKPFVLHCKSGADRAGFASAIYLLVIEGRPLREARRMLSARYIHFSWSKTGVLDHIFDLYEARTAKGPIPFEAWVATEYDHLAIQKDFEETKKPIF
ncbi:MAG: tyrosine-protein phosphatase [Pseudomonadota bacterium]